MKKFYYILILICLLLEFFGIYLFVTEKIEKITFILNMASSALVLVLVAMFFFKKKYFLNTDYKIISDGVHIIATFLDEKQSIERRIRIDKKALI